MKTNKLLAILLAIITAFSIFTITTVAADSPDTVQMGDNIIGTYNADHTVLTISGSGEMWDHRYIKEYYWDGVEYAGKVELDREKIEQIIFDEDSEITSIGAYMFMRSKLETVVLPDSVKKVKEYAFAYCENLKNVDLGKVEEIENYAFSGFNKLTTITLPKELKTLSRYAFNEFESNWTYIDPSGWCSRLETVNIGESKIDYSYIVDAFRNCCYLQSYTFSEKNTKYTVKDGILFNKAMTKLIHAPQKSVTNSYEIPSTVTKICSYAFYRSSITSIVFNENLEEIAPGAFMSSDLETVNIGESKFDYPYIVDAFKQCSYLKNYTVSENNTKYTVKDGILFNKAMTKLIHAPQKSVTNSYKIPSTVTKICSYAFYYCPITSIVFNEKLEEIATGAFWKSELTSVSFTKNIKKICKDSFYCSKLETVNIGESKIDYSYIVNAFKTRSSFKNYTVSAKNTKYTAKDGVLFNKAMTKLIHAPKNFKQKGYNIPSTVTKICSYAFYNSPITSMVLNEKLEAIATGAFMNSSLTSISLTKNIKKICKGAFYYSKIEKISVGTCEATGLACATRYADILKSFTVSKSNKAYSVIDGVLFNKKQTKIVRYPRLKSGQTYEIPKTVKYIGAYSFARCLNLNSITALGEIKSVGNYAFGYHDKKYPRPGGLKITLNNTKTAPTFGKDCFINEKLLQFYTQNKTVAKNIKANIISADTNFKGRIKIYSGKEVVYTLSLI